MTRIGFALWREPRPTPVPPVGRHDWLLVGGAEAVALVEGIARPHLTGQPFVTLLVMAVLPSLLWRRSHPLAACLIAFGAAGALSVVQLATKSADIGLLAMMAVLISLYSLVRWGSGREMLIGLPYVALVATLGMYAGSARPADVVGGVLFLLLFVALGAVFRYRAALWQRQQREVRNEERLALARELHDTVAHHVSAIAVQAQAGMVVAATQPEQATRVLATIESEAARTLEEMRDMVRVLREAPADAYAPQSGVADLPRLARADAVPVVDVRVEADVAHLPRPVDVALFRIAQESLTNALRHAVSATRVEIQVRRAGGLVTLRVVDDGLTRPGAATRSGFGLTGMAERAQLLGGSFSARPDADGGWVVEAALPLELPS